MKIRAYFPLIAISLVALVVRLIMIPFAGVLHVNPVDVYYVDNEAAKLILEFRDPYLYSNYTNRFGEIVTFAYLPFVPLYFAPFVLIGSDIRYGSVFADVMITIALYFIGKSLLEKSHASSWIPFTGSIAYAILPASIFLTSVMGTNQMIGLMFLIVALAVLLEDKSLLAGVFLGLALATNQFVLLVFPVLLIYCLRNRNFKTILVSILVASAIILPFLLYSPSGFLYDIMLFQFVRPMQQNGIWSLYHVVYMISGFKVDTFLRVAIFLVPTAIATFLFSNSKRNMLIGIALVSAIASVVLPNDGFWNYFLMPMAVICSLIPLILISADVGRFSLSSAENSVARHLDESF